MSRQNKLRNKRANREAQLWHHNEKGLRTSRRKGQSFPFNYKSASKRSQRATKRITTLSQVVDAILVDSLIEVTKSL